MMSIKRTAAVFGATGAMAFGAIVPAQAATDAATMGGDDSKATCRISAQRPYIVGGVGRTAAGKALVRCVGGGAQIRVQVFLQKKIGYRWVNQRPPTTCVGFVGSGQTKSCTERNGASPGLWRTWAKGTIVSNGSSAVAISGTTRFVPAKAGLAAS